MPLSQIPNLYIANHDIKGRCVFCTDDIQKGSLIEICPVVVLSIEDTKLIHQTHLYDYYFAWDTDKNTSAIALGYGSLYNHSPNPNAETERFLDQNEIKISAISAIPAGKEITIDYQGTAKDESCVIWFDVVE